MCWIDTLPFANIVASIHITVTILALNNCTVHIWFQCHFIRTWSQNVSLALLTIDKLSNESFSLLLGALYLNSEVAVFRWKYMKWKRIFLWMTFLWFWNHYFLLLSPACVKCKFNCELLFMTIYCIYDGIYMPEKSLFNFNIRILPLFHFNVYFPFNFAQGWWMTE